MSGSLKPAATSDNLWQEPVQLITIDKPWQSPEVDEFEEFDEIFRVTTEKDLAECNEAKDRRKLLKFRLEVTLSLPPTAEYERHSDLWKQRKLKSMFRELVNFWHYHPGIDIKIISDICFIEYGFQHGRIHLHGLIDLATRDDHSPKGCVQSSVRQILRTHSKWKTHGTYQDYAYYEEYARYVTQNVCMQYIGHADETERITAWENYIKKNAPKNCV